MSALGSIGFGQLNGWNIPTVPVEYAIVVAVSERIGAKLYSTATDLGNISSVRGKFPDAAGVRYRL